MTSDGWRTYGIICRGKGENVDEFKPVVEAALAKIGLEFKFWRLSRGKIILVDEDKPIRGGTHAT